MTTGPSLCHSRACSRCHLFAHGESDIKDGWCLFCRRYRDEQGPAEVVAVWKLLPDRTLRTCTPAQLGTWEATGRHVVAQDMLQLRDGRSATLVTTFLCVDYWPAGVDPLLFDTRLHDMNTGASFDRSTRRYATYAEAAGGHVSERTRLIGAGAAVDLWG